MLAASKTKKNSSIVASLTLWYIGLTIVNIAVFWVGAGSNQMRLISEKATITARGVAFEVIRRIQVFTDTVATMPGPEKHLKASAEKFNALLQKGNPPDLLRNYKILSTRAELLLAWPAGSAQAGDPSSAEILDSLKAIQLKEAKGEPFIGVPDLQRKEIDIFIPLTQGKASDLILATRLPLHDIQQEIAGMVRLGIGMVVLLLMLQTGMGIMIYRKFVRPIQRVSNAALRLSQGNYDPVTNDRKKADEINQLIESFNSMSRDLKKNKDKMELELDIAKNIQSSILPKTLTAGPIKAEIHYNPLQVVSGDYYDFLHLPDGSAAIFIGDASGHGVPAAFITVMAKVYFTSLVEKIESPAELLTVMNRRMAEYFSGAGLYLTAFYMRVFPDGRAVYCNAQHPEPVVLRHDGTTEKLKATGFYVGMLKKVFREYKDEKIFLKAGDRLVLYTDGLSEAENSGNVQLGADKLLQEIEAGRGKTAGETIASVTELVSAFRGEAARQDDETLIVIDVGELAAPEQRTAAAPARSMAFEADARFIEAQSRAIRKIEPAFRYWLRKAEKALKEKKLYEALVEFIAMQVKYPQDSGILFDTGVTLYGLRYYQDAEFYLAECTRIDPGFADAYWLRSLAAVKSGDGVAAREHIARALAIKPRENRYLKALKAMTGVPG